MKLWYSFSKELKLSSKSWYFYLELGMASVLLMILIFVVPEDFESKGKEYIYLDLPQVVRDNYAKNLLEEDVDETVEYVEIEANEESYTAMLYESDASKIYLLETYRALEDITDSERVPTVYVHANEDNQIVFTYYLQGYETQKLKNLLGIAHNRFAGHDVVEAYSDQLEVRRLYQDSEPLNDRENIIPVFLTFNGSLMSLFMIASYIFLDKGEGIIKAYAVTASSVWHYLLSKMGVIITTSIFTTLIITIPIMGAQANYPMLLVFLMTSGFFAAALGLLLTSFYDDIVEAFGAIFVVIVIMIIPNISYFTPSWSPEWVKFIPSYVMLQSFKDIISVGGNMTYVFLASLGFLSLGIGLFALANYRFKKTLSL